MFFPFLISLGKTPATPPSRGVINLRWVGHHFHRDCNCKEALHYCAVHGRFSCWNLGLLWLIEDPNFRKKSGHVQPFVSILSWNWSPASQLDVLAMGNMHVMYSHEMFVTLRIESLTPAERWAKASDEHETITVFHAESRVVKLVLSVRTGLTTLLSAWKTVIVSCSSDRTSLTTLLAWSNKDLVHNHTPYQHRGWCIGEMEWSSDRQAIAQNQLINIRLDTDTAGQQGTQRTQFCKTYDVLE